MKRKAVCLAAVLLCCIALFFTVEAYAENAGIAAEWMTGELLVVSASALLAILGGAMGVLFKKVSRTFRETGEFLTTIGMAIEDRRITRDELAAIIREGKDVFDMWR